jgi:predicted transcriptional regulator
MHIYPLNNLARPSSSSKDLLTCLYDLSPLDMHLLVILLQARKQLTLEELTEKIDRDKSTVFRSVQKMVTLGLCLKEARSLKEGGYYHIYSASDAGTIKKNAKQKVEEIHSSLDRIMQNFEGELNEMATLDPGRLRLAVEKSLATLGGATKKALMRDLKNNGISFDYPCSSVKEVEDVLNRLVGEGVASVVMENVRTALVLDRHQY